MKHPLRYIVLFCTAVMLVNTSCKQKSAKIKQEVITPRQMDSQVQDEIQSLLEEADTKASSFKDSLMLYALPVIKYVYDADDYSPVWSSSQKWKTAASSLLSYLGECENDGLFKEDYRFAHLQSITQTLDKDSIKRKDALLWAKADILMTDAFVKLIQDLKQGRLQGDSLAWKNNPDYYEVFFKTNLDKLKAGNALSSLAQNLQPTHQGYLALKNSLPFFLDSMDKRKYTYLLYPNKDSVLFIKKLVQRLSESGIIAAEDAMPDSVQLQELVQQYQKQKGLKPTGKVNAALVTALNNTGLVKFKRIAITLDRFKQLPDQLPEKYIWVNLPSYYLQVWDTDSVALESKIIIGKPATPTPNISSEISNLVIYPTWTVPNSIIIKEILPGLKKNPDYLRKKDLALYDNKGDLVDPYSVDWTRYTKGIPYFVRQNSGDNNALGVIKFNFKNPFDVYLHDTNQRYLFKNKNRSLSHGCVRVQEWQKLAFYIIRNDSMSAEQPELLKTNTDSIMQWIARKQIHRVSLSKQVPLFIGYFTCEGNDGRIKFYEDVYNDDKLLMEKYFALK